MADSEQTTDELPNPERRSATGMAEPPVIAAGRRLGGRYRLERRLGHGGMAVVWLATDERLGREVAVKVLSDTFSSERDYLGRFAREARVAAGLQHPNLVSVYDYDAGERPYLVMEYIEGGDLAVRLETGKAPPAEELAEQLLSALRHIHAAGVLHRDIKPQNVLVDGHGHARLTDFGIAMPADATALTRTGEVIGTKSYLAPEVLRGRPATERSDLFALGVVLADAAREGADAAFWGLTDRLRDPDPDARPESADAALAELGADRPSPPPGEPTRPYAIETEPLATATTGRAPFEPTPTAVRSSPRRNRILALGAIAAIAAAALVFALAGGSDGGGGGEGAAAGNGAQADTSSSGSGGGNGGAGPAGGSSAEPVAEEPPAEEPPAAEPPTPGAGADPAALNDQGFALLGDQRYEEAVPVLEQAVDGLRDSGDDATYNYALYNLAGAYLGAGRPADAIPLLEERLGYDDGQLDEVQATLDRAYAEAGVEPPAEPGSEKPGKGPKNGTTPPPFEEGD